MSQRVIVLKVLCALLSVTGALSSTHCFAAEGQDCSPVGDLRFVCGVSNVEDFLPVDGGRWLVGGSLRSLDPAPSAIESAGLYLIDTAAKTVQPVALSVGAQGDPRYPGCSAPDLKHLNTHGLDIGPGSALSTTVYAVNHDGRQSIEVFRLHPAEAVAEWIGCVILPPAAVGNAVAVLTDGGFVVSKFIDAADPDSMKKALSGQVTGVVYRWRPGKGFNEVPGTTLSGANGVLVSRDQKWLFVNAWGSQQIHRVPLAGKGQRTVVNVDFSPDNLRWAPDGSIFVTGQFLKTGGADTLNGWATARLDPLSMTVAPVLQEPGYPQFDNGTSTVQTGDTLWIGTFRGNRIAYRSAPTRETPGVPH